MRHPALRTGTRIPVPTDSESVYAFLRQDETERILVILNFADERVETTLNLGEGGAFTLRNLIAAETLPDVTGPEYRVTVEPLAGWVLQLIAK